MALKKLNPEAIMSAVQNGSLTNSTRSQGETSRREAALPKHWVSALFKKFQARYMHKWTSAIEGIEGVAVDEWAAVLAGITGEQVKRGLEKWDKDWPPTASEFRKCCLGRNKNDFGLDYTPECYREKITDKSRLLSSDKRETSRDEARARIAEIRGNLK